MLLKYAGWVIGGAILALLIYEAFALFNSSKGDTISEIVWKASVSRPLIPFLLGLLMGHFFWQRGNTP